MSSIGDYVKKQLRLGKSKAEIRRALESQGWPRKDIDRAFSEATGSKAKAIILVIGLAAVLVTGLTLYAFLPDFSDESTAPSVAIPEPAEPVSNDLEGVDNCVELPYTTEKQSCYFEIVEEDRRVCETLDDSREANFCFRALEDVLLT